MRKTDRERGRLLPITRRDFIHGTSLAALGLMLPLSHQTQTQAQNEADVIVYGSTPGGFCAAIAAAREGASVILLEPTDHVGGVNTGGLSHSDSNQTVRSTVMGLFDEWHTRIEKDYASRGVTLPYQVRVKDQAIWTYEPHVAARVTRQMLEEAPSRAAAIAAQNPPGVEP